MRLYYQVNDLGDGSYSVNFFTTEEDLNRHQQEEEEEYGYLPEGEGIIDFDVINGEIKLRN